MTSDRLDVPREKIVSTSASAGTKLDVYHIKTSRVYGPIDIRLRQLLENNNAS